MTLARMAGARLKNAVDGEDLRTPIDRVSKLLGWLTPRAPKRVLTVIGTPHYTRSIASIDGPMWLITSAPAENRPNRPAPVAERGASGVLYKIPVRHYRPFLVTVQHVARKPTCEAEAMVKILPSTPYFQQAVKFRGSIPETARPRLSPVSLFGAVLSSPESRGRFAAS